MLFSAGFILLSGLHAVLAQTDCSLVSTGATGVSVCLFSGTYSTTVYCYYPYTCCTDGTNGCCFGGLSSDLYTTAELVGIFLNATAMFLVGILAILICGATYCNDTEDASHIFMNNRRG